MKPIFMFVAIAYALSIALSLVVGLAVVSVMASFEFGLRSCSVASNEFA